MIEMYLLPFTPLAFEWIDNEKGLIAMYGFYFFYLFKKFAQFLLLINTLLSSSCEDSKIYLFDLKKVEIDKTTKALKPLDEIDFHSAPVHIIKVFLPSYSYSRLIFFL